MDYHLITCIVERGRAERVADEALRAGAQGVTIYHARGKGVRERLGLLGHLIDPEKEVLLVVTGADRVRGIFDTIVRTARIEEPGKGFVYVQTVQRVAGYMDAGALPATSAGAALQRAVKRSAIPRRKPAPKRPRRRRRSS